jgi:4-carboxymuconolactone decarboxylase
MTIPADRDAGLKVRRAVLGDAHVDRSLARVNAFNGEFQDLIIQHAWADIWTRPGLDRRARSVIVLSITVALGRMEEFRLHVKGAIHNGLTPDEIREVLLQCAVYAGVPAANTAFKEAEAVLTEMGMIGKDPA